MILQGLDPDRVRQEWQPFDWQTLPHPGPESRGYAAWYGLDFARRLDLRHSFGYQDVAGYRIAVHAWLPAMARGTIFLLHGYFDHVGLYQHVIGSLLEQDWAVVAHDLPGHGLSSGERAAIHSFADYQTVLEALMEGAVHRFPEPWYGLGQSTGGAILLEHARQDQVQQRSARLTGQVLLAPLVRPRSFRSSSLLHGLIGRFTPGIARYFSANSGDPRFLHFLQWMDPLQPRAVSSRWFGALREWVPQFERSAPLDGQVTVIQGDQDMTVDWRHNLDVVQSKFPSVRGILIPGARHHLANEQESLRRQVLAHIHDSLH